MTCVFGQVEGPHGNNEFTPEAQIVGVTFMGICFDNDPMTTDKILQFMSQMMAVKSEEIPAPSEEILPVDQIVQTHASISKRFTDGRSFEDLIEGLNSERIDPMNSPFLKLDVVHWPGRGHFSLRNRRLCCLKLHQRHVHPKVVKIRVRIFPLNAGFVQLMEANPMYEAFMRAYDTRDRGRSVNIRGGEHFRWQTPPADRQRREPKRPLIGDAALNQAAKHLRKASAEASPPCVF